MNIEYLISTMKDFLPDNIWKTIGLIMIGAHTGHWLFWVIQKRKERLESLTKLVGTQQETISANRLHCENQHNEVLKSIDRLTESTNNLAQQMMSMVQTLMSHIQGESGGYKHKRKTDFPQDIIKNG